MCAVVVSVSVVGAANKDMTSQVSSFMVEMVCRYTMVAVSQQAGNIIGLSDFIVHWVTSLFGLVRG